MLLAIAASMCQPLSPELKDFVKMRKPRCSPLEVSSKELSRMQCSQAQQCYLRGKALYFDDETMKSNYRRSLNASKQARVLKRKSDEIVEVVKSKRIEPQLSLQRVSSIEYLFHHLFGHPKPEFWKDLNMVPEIMRRLDIPRGSRECVVNVLNRCMEQQENCFDTVETRGRKALITSQSSEEYIILNGVMRQLSFSAILSEVNMWRKSLNKSIYSWSTIQRFVSNHPLVVTNVRGVIKSGSSDVESVWAKARLAQCSQWLQQLSLGEVPTACDSPLRPIVMHGIAF